MGQSQQYEPNFEYHHPHEVHELSRCRIGRLNSFHVCLKFNSLSLPYESQSGTDDLHDRKIFTGSVCQAVILRYPLRSKGVNLCPHLQSYF